MRERLAKAEVRISGEIFTASFCFFFISPPGFLIIPFLNLLDLIAQLESLRSAADHAAGSINARGVASAIRLHDIPNRVREVTLHGIHHGAATALVAAQVRSGQDLRLLPHGFPDAVYPGEHERLVEDFMNVANSVAFNTLADDIVSKVFSGL